MHKRFKKLHYKAEGTDIQVELPKDHIWLSGASKNAQNVPYIANMPTEEVYTAPLKNWCKWVCEKYKTTRISRKYYG